MRSYNEVGARVGLEFYVIDDLRKNGYHIEYYNSLDAALEAFARLDGSAGKMPVLGVQKGNVGLDLVHRVNGEDVLVTDYKNGSLSPTMHEVRPELEALSDCLREELGVGRTYSRAFFDRVGRSCPVVVPLGNDDGFDSSYCDGKRLKTISPFGFDSINELFIVGHGWVDFRAVREDFDSYCSNGVLPVEWVNVNYALENSFAGVDGQMDISAHDFERMLEDINKEYSLRVSDRHLGNWYIVGSYAELADAVKAWYDVPPECRAYVSQTVGYGYSSSVFSGVDDDFNEIPYEKAAMLYGFQESGVVELLQDATNRSMDAHKAWHGAPTFIKE